MRLARTVGVIVAVSLGVVILVGFNVWVFRYAKSGTSNVPAAFDGGSKAPSPEILLKGDSLPKQGVTLSNSLPAATPTSSPTPTPRPTGPGAYACDPYGVCNKYSDEARGQYCSVTFADSLCLDQCADKTKQCTL